MERIPEVETARALMTEAMTWSVMKWLREKKRVRKTADQANAALDQIEPAVKDRWPRYESRLRGAGRPNGGKVGHPQPAETAAIDRFRGKPIAKKIKEADDAAYRARMDAEEDLR